MKALRAKVTGGRLVLDQPTDLPEGTELDLFAVDGGDDLTDEERARLHAAILSGSRSVANGERIPAEDVLRDLESEA